MDRRASLRRAPMSCPLFQTFERTILRIFHAVRMTLETSQSFIVKSRFSLHEKHPFVFSLGQWRNFYGNICSISVHSFFTQKTIAWWSCVLIDEWIIPTIMTSPHSLTFDDQNPISIIDREKIYSANRDLNPLTANNQQRKTTCTERLKSYFTTNDGRIMLSDLFFTLICVILQHVMGTCDHSVSDGTTVIKWHVFTPPCRPFDSLNRAILIVVVGAGPHTAVFFFVLSWTTLAYCLERIWVYLITGARVSKKRDLIVHGIIVALYFTALGFNIWGKGFDSLRPERKLSSGYVLCESTSQLNTSKAFSPGVCRGDSQAWWADIQVYSMFVMKTLF